MRLAEFVDAGPAIVNEDNFFGCIYECEAGSLDI